MIYLKLFLAFFKIGLFSFGGGYAMIPLIQKEIESNGWMQATDFANIIAIAEMTPGPIAINSATFVGYKATGFFGGLVATTGVALPSLILVFLISQFFFKFQEHLLNKAIFYGVRPVIVGLIASAAVFVSETALFKKELSYSIFTEIFTKPIQVINIEGVVIFAASLFAIIKLKLHPIIVVIGSGVVGAVIFSFLTL